MFAEIIASIKDWLNRKSIEDAHNKAKVLSIGEEIILGRREPPIGPYVEHPLHKQRLIQYAKNVQEVKASDIDTIAFGDSLIDIPRNDWTQINEKVNFAISGSWANHMQQMAVEISPILKMKGIEPKNVIIGTLGGNPLLAYQNVDATISISINCLDKIRELFPSAKIIVYGLPPVYNAWATKYSLKFEGKMYEWVNKDVNAVFIPIFSNFGSGVLYSTPNIQNSSDGVHLSNTGVVKLDKLFKRAKSATPKSIID